MGEESNCLEILEGKDTASRAAVLGRGKRSQVQEGGRWCGADLPSGGSRGRWPGDQAWTHLDRKTIIKTL